MKKEALFFVFLMLIPFAGADWFYNSQTIVTGIDISSSAEVVPTGINGYIDTATINMTFYPKQYKYQQILALSTDPDAEIKDSTIKFTWQNPKGKINFGLNADVKTTNKIIEIDRKINFPIQNLPDDIIIYTKPSPTIDSNNQDIIRLASELAKGEDDLYSAVFKIADWTKNNINYNLSTLTADVSQKASWVLQYKEGVCDELTSLFIALLRAIGVPGRFVSGVAYTNSELFPENWGPHGWAEVYFPDYGWVPFDVTYGEYGWVDPTHVKFKDSVDSDEASTYYQWVGRNADLKSNKLDIKVKLRDRAGYYQAPVGLSASTLKKAVSFGSFNLVEASVENNAAFYYATELLLSKPKEVKIIGDDAKSILLRPGEKKKVFWIIKVDDGLESRYSYNFPLVVSTVNNITSKTSFTSSIRDNSVSLGEVEQASIIAEQEKEKSYSANVLLECKPEKTEFYEYEEVNAHCIVKNTGNVFLDKVKICFENKCSVTDFGISQSRDFVLKLDKSVIGQRESTMTLTNDLISKSFYVNYKVNDQPNIEIGNLIYPSNVSFDKKFVVSFTIDKKSLSVPKNVEVVMLQNGVRESWSLNSLSSDRDFSVNFEGSQLRYEKNDYEINVVYYDDSGRKYITNKKFSIELKNASAQQRLVLFLNSFDGVSYGTIALMFLAGTIAFLGVILILFRRNKRTKL